VQVQGRRRMKMSNQRIQRTSNHAVDVLWCCFVVRWPRACCPLILAVGSHYSHGVMKPRKLGLDGRNLLTTMADTLYRESASVVSTFPMLKGFLNPLVEAHSRGLCGGNNFGVELGGNPYHKLSGKAFEWLDSIFTAHIKEDLKRRMPLSLEPFNVCRIKVGTPVQPHEFSPEHGDFRVIRDHGLHPVDFDYVSHGITPLASSHFRMLSTALLSVSGEGCGLWKTRRSPKKRTPTREPSRSLISAPNSRNRERTSSQWMFPGVGRVKIKSSVRLCFRFMDFIVSIYGIESRRYGIDHGTSGGRHEL